MAGQQLGNLIVPTKGDAVQGRVSAHLPIVDGDAGYTTHRSTHSTITLVGAFFIDSLLPKQTLRLRCWTI